MKKYIFGFDLLRIILMLFIVIGHLFAHTPFNSPFEFLGFKWIFSWLIQSFTVCAVNCFILMTGFLMINKNFKTQRILKLWGRVYFYSVLLFIIFIIIDPNNLSFYNIKLSIFPVFNSTYWFFTCYVVLLLFMPFINILITRLKTKQLILLNLIIICLFFILPIFAVFFKELDSTHGYSIIQFISLYIIGGTIKKLNISFKKWKLVISLITTILTIFVSKIVLELIVSHYSLSVGTSLFYRNNTIFVLVEAIILLLIFKDTLVIENKNNIMLDQNTGKFLTIIDLDTVMKGSLLYDYGDALRFGASYAKEDETDLKKVGVNLKLVEAFTEGFLEELKPRDNVNCYKPITPLEVLLFYQGFRIITIECAMRFLMDYIEGDHYFRIDKSRPEHNLERARNQLKLAKEIEKNEMKIKRIINKLLIKLHYDNAYLIKLDE